MEMKQNIEILNIALKLLQIGISIVPAHDNEPTIEWEKFQRRKPSIEEVKWWFSNPQNDQIGLICGKISNGLVYVEIQHNLGKYAGKISQEFFFCSEAEGNLENMIIGEENTPFQTTLVVSGLVIPQISYEDTEEVNIFLKYLFYPKEIDLKTLIGIIASWGTAQKFWKYVDKFQQYYKILTDKKGFILAFSGFLRKYLNLSLTQTISIISFALIETKDIKILDLHEVIEKEILPELKYAEGVYILSPEYVQVDKWFKELGLEQLERELFNLLDEASLDKFSLDKYI